MFDVELVDTGLKGDLAGASEAERARYDCSAIFWAGDREIGRFA